MIVVEGAPPKCVDGGPDHCLDYDMVGWLMLRFHPRDRLVTDWQGPKSKLG
jgi:hypothetical protein